MKKIFFYILIIFISGCTYSGSSIKNDFFNRYYIKVRNNMFLNMPEYHSLKDRISKQEYRMLPNYLQYYYEKE